MVHANLDQRYRARADPGGALHAGRFEDRRGVGVRGPCALAK